MITGFNTDIEYEGVTYHVQTEDKGLSKPMILSLVYNGGTILASRRSPYDDLLKGDFDEKLLEERLNRQHKLICAAIRAGRIEDLKRMSAKEVHAASAATALTDASAAEPFINSIPPVPRPDTGELNPPIPRPDFGEEFDLDALMDTPEIDIGAISIIEVVEEVVLPETAVEIVSDMAGRERPGNDKLIIDLIGETDLKGGDRKTIGMMVCRGSDKRVVPEAQIMVKIIGSTFRPLIFHSMTDENGIARVNLQFPSFKSGRAALLVRAMSEGEEVELRRPIAIG
ncbi:MAG TPA: hypothetical protein PKD24_01560 [Pyrinomonadaceae bacterium]|nr:hypothetical protein [Pyrinomonadaceae bacterium]HMP64155.1 hypothetical protein [Pyrinomonadaceae bacterium]